MKGLFYLEEINQDGSPLKHWKIRIVDRATNSEVEMVPRTYADLFDILWTGRRFGWIDNRCLAYALVEAVLDCDLEFQFVMMKHCGLHQRHAARFRERRDIAIDQNLCYSPDLYDADIMYGSNNTLYQLEAVSLSTAPRPKKARMRISRG